MTEPEAPQQAEFRMTVPKSWLGQECEIIVCAGGEFKEPKLAYWDYADDRYHSPETTREIDAWLYHTDEGKQAFIAKFRDWWQGVQ